MPRVHALLIVALAMLAGAVLPAGARAAWTNPVTISPPFMEAGSPDVGIDATGRAVVVWRSGEGDIGVATRGPDGTLGTPRTVASGDAQDPAVASWAMGGATFLRVRRPSGTFSAATRVSPSTDFASEPRLAVEPGGRAFATWLSHNAMGAAVVRGRARDAAGTLSAPGTLSGAPGEVAPEHSLALDSAGTALLAWTKTLGGEGRVHARTRAAAGTLGPIATLSQAGAGADAVEAAISRTEGRASSRGSAKTPASSAVPSSAA
jgi:hypothetical protein